MAPKEGTRAFLRFDSPSRGRVLEPGIIEEIRDSRWMLVFRDRFHFVEVGEEKRVYYHRGHDFLEQRVRVETRSSDDTPSRLTVLPLGEPVSADTRSEARVATSDSGLAAAIADEQHCSLQDVSLSGFAVIANGAHPVGRTVDVALRFEGEEFPGEAEIRGALPLADGRTRYGLFGVFDVSTGRALRNGLTRMTLEIQQSQLRQRT
jgi:hypothetical protein